MVDKYKHHLMRHLQHRDYKPAKADSLAEQLNIPDDDLEAFNQAIEELQGEGQLVIGSRDAVGLPPIAHEIIGKFRLNPKGFGFVIPENANAHGDLFIPANGVNGALTNDMVRASIRYEKRGRLGQSPVVGRIIEIIERGSSTYVGVLKQRGSKWFVIPDGKMLKDHILIRDSAQAQGNHGKKVVVELTQFPDRTRIPEGVITKVLGETGAPDVETEAVIEAFGLPGEFPENVVDEAREINRAYNADEDKSAYMAQRVDLRDTFTTTIDPPDAKDFDDAISIQKLHNGHWELAVHIADVSTFVAQGSELDLEAYDRGNSCYLPRRVIPMLPEILSNGICSLQPGVPRLTKTVFITLDSTGHPIKSRFCNAIIQSDHRMTYLEAQAIIDDRTDEAAQHARSENQYTPQLIQTLKWMNELASIIRKRRLEQGMIVLALPEAELVYDDEGKVVDAQPEDDAFTHTIIEMFMVEANEAAARVFSNLNIPVIRRIHPDPTSYDTDTLRAFANVAGYVIPEKPTRKQLQQLLDSVRGKPAQLAVHFAVLKTLTKAEYAPLLIGHFALASEHYAHFTSPIRRYADLTVHRALDALFEHNGDQPVPKDSGEKKKLSRRLSEDPRCPHIDDLKRVASHISGTERNAESAERELTTFLVLQLLQNHVGETWGGVVTGVAKFGIFVQLDKFLVEGRIDAVELPGAPREQWRFNQDIGQMVNMGTGRRIGVGDRFNVTITRIDLVRREMNLLIDHKNLPPVSEDDKAALQAMADEPRQGRGAGHRGQKSRDAQAGNDSRQGSRSSRSKNGRKKFSPKKPSAAKKGKRTTPKHKRKKRGH